MHYDTTNESRTETFLCLWKSEISLKLYFTVLSNRVIYLKEYQLIFSVRRTNLTKSSDKTHFASLDLVTGSVNESPTEWEKMTVWDYMPTHGSTLQLTLRITSFQTIYCTSTYSPDWCNTLISVHDTHNFVKWKRNKQETSRPMSHVLRKTRNWNVSLQNVLFSSI